MDAKIGDVCIDSGFVNADRPDKPNRSFVFRAIIFVVVAQLIPQAKANLSALTAGDCEKVEHRFHLANCPFDHSRSRMGRAKNLFNCSQC